MPAIRIIVVQENGEITAELTGEAGEFVGSAVFLDFQELAEWIAQTAEEEFFSD